ncbi:murein biosynthesis integral membrane protein MurJ [Yinghuangia sp. ASG 101]|uniref:murein biosynthesis integral membrane protein MurJ n=1 Tax=Yinghuangia sp. ASG 101 TaxID=2896848 RepID=UPI001E5CCA91|nr:murein biosynthesis integral membrane protein MurJ [Yinghuangia sp. ASG 101]UGQ08884.1 murein biosynthesis integral membrane protein MurJ [Yinghuangia sp. ASG 101]
MNDRSDERQPYHGGTDDPGDGQAPPGSYVAPYQDEPHSADPYLGQYGHHYSDPAQEYAPYPSPPPPGPAHTPQGSHGDSGAWFRDDDGQGGGLDDAFAPTPQPPGVGPGQGYGGPGYGQAGYDSGPGYGAPQTPDQSQSQGQGQGYGQQPYGAAYGQGGTPGSPSGYGGHDGQQGYGGSQGYGADPYAAQAQNQQFGAQVPPQQEQQPYQTPEHGGYGGQGNYQGHYQAPHEAPPAPEPQAPPSSGSRSSGGYGAGGGWGDYDRPGGWLMDQTLTGIHLGLTGEIGMPTYTEAYQRYESRQRAEAEAEAASSVGVLEPDVALPEPSQSPVYRLPGSGAEERMAGIPVGGKKGGKLSGMMRSSALMASGTIISRITGFVRSLVIAAALGTAVFANTYNVANTMPTLLYILVGGGALNAVFVPQLVRAMRNDDDGGEAYANRLLTLVMVMLLALTALAVVAAPWLIRILANSLAEQEAEFELATTFARYCLPIIFFMGLHVMFGQILNARERYGPMMWTPVLNNVVIIATFGLYIWAAGTQNSSGMTAARITDDEARLLGIGTLLGMIVQSLAMVPYLRAARFHFRPRFDWRGHGLGKAAGLAKWTFLFVLANQLGYLVTTQLANAIDSDAQTKGITWGVGFSAYTNALLVWQFPQAVITVSVMAAMLPRMSRAAADNDTTSVRDDISAGLRMSAVAIVPCAVLFVALGRDIGGLIFAPTGQNSAHWIGYMLMALGLGLIPFSAQYVLLRGFYAYEDTRTPFLNTVWVAATTAALSGLAYLALPTKWAGVGMAGAYGAAYLVGVLLAARRLKARIGDLDGRRVTRTYTRLITAAAIGGVAAFATARFCTNAMGSGFGGSLAAVLAGTVVMIVVFVIAASRMRIEEMSAMTGMVKGRLGR